VELVTDPDRLIPLLIQSTAAFALRLEQLSVLLPPKGEHDPRDDAARSMARRAAHLVSACALVAPQLRNEAIVILTRAVLENLITLLWVIETPERPEVLRSEGCHDMRRSARKNMQLGLLRVLRRPNAEDCTQEFLRRSYIKEIPRGLSVAQRARAAGVYDLYAVFYTNLSRELHGFALDEVALCPAVSTCGHLQALGAFSNCTAVIAESWLTERTRPDNERLRTTLGLPSEGGGG
jgi:hypothetical protein